VRDYNDTVAAEKNIIAQMTICHHCSWDKERRRDRDREKIDLGEIANWVRNSSNATHLAT